jgi:hypothetical protein
VPSVSFPFRRLSPPKSRRGAPAARRDNHLRALVGKAQRDGGQFYVGHKAKHPIGSMGYPLLQCDGIIILPQQLNQPALEVRMLGNSDAADRLPFVGSCIANPRKRAGPELVEDMMVLKRRDKVGLRDDRTPQGDVFDFQRDVQDDVKSCEVLVDPRAQRGFFPLFAVEASDLRPDTGVDWTRDIEAPGCLQSRSRGTHRRVVGRPSRPLSLPRRCRTEWKR